MTYCRNLGFKARPDYTMLRKLFSDVRVQLQKKDRKLIQDHDFQWNDGKDLGNLKPIGAWTGTMQPDDNPRSEMLQGLSWALSMKSDSKFRLDRSLTSSTTSGTLKSSTSTETLKSSAGQDEVGRLDKSLNAYSGLRYICGCRPANVAEPTRRTEVQKTPS